MAPVLSGAGEHERLREPEIVLKLDRQARPHIRAILNVFRDADYAHTLAVTRKLKYKPFIEKLTQDDHISIYIKT